MHAIHILFVVMFPKVDGGKVQFMDARLPDEVE